MADLDTLNDQVSALNAQVKVANNTSQHMAKDLDEIKDILRDSLDNMNRLFTRHEVEITHLKNSDNNNKKKISDLQSHVDKASSNINKVQSDFDSHVSYTSGVMDTIRWVKWFAFGGGAAGFVAAFKAFLL